MPPTPTPQLLTQPSLYLKLSQSRSYIGSVYSPLLSANTHNAHSLALERGWGWRPEKSSGSEAKKGVEQREVSSEEIEMKEREASREARRKAERDEEARRWLEEMARGSVAMTSARGKEENGVGGEVRREDVRVEGGVNAVLY